MESTEMGLQFSSFSFVLNDPIQKTGCTKIKHELLKKLKEGKIHTKFHFQTYLRGGEPSSEPQIDAYDIVSSFDMATKFSGAVDNLLISLKYPFWRPEYERGVRSSGVAPPTEFRRGVGVMDPFPFAR